MSKKILIVEDEALIAMEMAATVEDLGHIAIGFATTAHEALSLASNQSPDVALVDVNLADGPTGPQVGEALSRLGAKVVFVTANPRMLQGTNASAFAILEKPLCEATLAETLRAISVLANEQNLAETARAR